MNVYGFIRWSATADVRMMRVAAILVGYRSVGSFPVVMRSTQALSEAYMKSD